MKAVLDHTEDHGGNVTTFWFLPERPIRFTAGQYIELYLPHDEVDNRGARRWLTISSAPSNKMIGLTTRFPEKPSSYKQTMRTLTPDVTVSLSDPLGDFVLPKDSSVPLLFVASGTGSTPYASMVRWLLEHNETRDIQFIYTAKHPENLLFQDLWRSYKPLQMTQMLTSTRSDWGGRVGRLDVPVILEHNKKRDDSLIYLAGAQSLIEPLYNELLEYFPRNRMLLDYFPGY